MPYSRKIAITYYDCDVNFQIKISELVRQMMNTATMHAETIGIGYDALTKKNMAFLLSKNYMNIQRLPKVDEEIKISTVMTGCKGAKFIREIIVEDGQGNICVSSLTIWMLINIQTRKILRPTVLNIDSLPIKESIIKGSIKEQRFPQSIEGEHIGTKTIRAEYSYIDVNKHVNNSYYIDFICNALPYAELISKGIKSIELGYINEILPQTEISLNIYKTLQPNEYHLISQNNNLKYFEAIVVLNS